MWERYGFHAMGRRRSRSYEEHYLITWWYGYQRRDLFSSVYEDSEKIKALLDMNVMVRLRDAETLYFEAKDDPRCLQQSWLLEETDFCYAPESFNEINRDNDKDRVERTKQFIRSAFTEAQFDTERMKQIEYELRDVLPGNTDNTISDRKQVASCLAAGIPYFLTYDEDVLKRRAQMEDRYDVQVFTPQEFMLKIDEGLHKEEYRPVLLQGVAFHTLTKQDASSLQEKIELFLLTGQHEKKSSFKNVVNGCLNANGESYTVKAHGEEQAFYGVETTNEERIIPFLRLKEGNLKVSLLCQIVMGAVQDCVKYGWKKLLIKERYLSDEEKGILIRLGFGQEGDGYVKNVCSKVVDRGQLPEVIGTMALGMTQMPWTAEELVKIEKKFFPLKIRNTGIPVYVIPIKALWAEHLFDSVRASENIFGAQPDKLWNFENVYYRHTKPLTEQAPARILWYVSGKNGTHAGTVAACSYLDEVYSGEAKEMYRRFKHYGIYEWCHVAQLCDGNEDAQVRVLKFSLTELFNTPVSFAEMQQVLERHGRKKNQFASPVIVPEEVFFEVYEMGK